MLRLFCERENAWHVVGEAGDCESACSIVEAMRPDLVLLDLALGGESGIDCLPQLLRLGANRVVVLTGNEDPESHARALENGASKVLRKGEPARKILSALREQAAVIAAETRSAVALKRTTSGAAAALRDIEGEAEAALDERERQIVEMLAAGRKDADIATVLGLSVSTVHHKVKMICHKLGVADRVALVVYAFQHHLATPTP